MSGPLHPKICGLLLRSQDTGEKTANLGPAPRASLHREVGVKHQEEATTEVPIVGPIR